MRCGRTEWQVEDHGVYTGYGSEERERLDVSTLRHVAIARMNGSNLLRRSDNDPWEPQGRHLPALRQTLISHEQVLAWCCSIRSAKFIGSISDAVSTEEPGHTSEVCYKSSLINIFLMPGAM